MNLSQRRLSRIFHPRLERAVFAVGAILIAAAHAMLFAHAGAIWRDEASSVRLVHTSTWAEMYAGLDTDSFPPLWITLLRLWHMMGFGAGDDWLRFFAVLLSLGLVVALWWNAKVTTKRLPVMALALVAFNPAVFYWGDSVRAYGLALLLITLFFGCVWRVTTKPNAGRIAAAVVVALLSVQSNYQNSYLILGVCVGGATVCLWRRLYCRAVLILGIGFVAGLSLLPLFSYLSRQGSASRIVRVPLDKGGFFPALIEALGGNDVGLVLIWGFLVVVTFAATSYFLFRRPSKTPEEVDRADGSLFAAIALLVSGLAMVAFVHSVGMPTLVWHLIPFLGLAAICIEMVISRLCRARGLVWVPAGGAICIILLSALPLKQEMETRRTNMDIIAQEISSSAAAGDYVLVNPYYIGPSFEHYYRGAAPYSLTPVLAPGQSYRVDTIQHLMAERDPLQATFEAIESTLKSGKRVWVVGVLSFPPEGDLPPKLSPAPHPVFGWASPPYVSTWSLQVGYFLRTHAGKKVGVHVTRDQRINPFEWLVLYVFEGWKEP